MRKTVAVLGIAVLLAAVAACEREDDAERREPP